MLDGRARIHRDGLEVAAKLDVVLTLTGSLLAGKYRVGGRLGGGGMGEVYEAVQEGLGRRVAIKVMSGPMASDPQLLERFQREARAVAALGHPHIVAVTDFQDNPGEPPFLVMERLVGESLGELLEREPMIDPLRACRIAEQTLSALAAAHDAGLVHRDVKPDNIFICKTDTGEIVKLLDFGVAKALEENQNKLTSTGAVVGTLVYMAPEQARGEPIDARADVYALGACLYHMLAGQVPFPATTAARLLTAVCTETPMPLSSLRPDIDGGLVAIVGRAMARDVRYRYATARAMMSEIGSYLRGEQIPSGPRTDPMSATALAGPIASYSTGAPLRYSGTPGPQTPHPQTPHPLTPQTPYMHPGSGGGVVVPPYGLAPSTAPPPSGGRNALAIVAVLAIVVGAGAAGTALYMRSKQTHTATIAPTAPIVAATAPPSVDLLAGGDLAPLGSNVAPINTTGPLGTTAQQTINTPPLSTQSTTPNPALGGMTSAQLVGVMTKAHMSGDGKTCLDAYDKLHAQPDFSDPANGYAMIHGDCLMSAGRCDEGRRIIRDYFSTPRPVMQQMTPQQIDQTVSSMAQMYCPTSQLAPPERAQRAQTLLYRSESSKDTVGASRYADELAAQLPSLPRGNEDERRKLIGYEYAIGKAYAENNRCGDARRHFHAECSLSSPGNPDACANALLNQHAACKTGP